MSAEDKHSDDGGDILDEEDIQCCHENYLVTILITSPSFIHL